MINYEDLKIQIDEKLQVIFNHSCPNYHNIISKPFDERSDSDWAALAELYHDLEKQCKPISKSSLLLKHSLYCFLQKKKLTNHDFYLIRLNLQACSDLYNPYGEDATNHNIINLIKSCFDVNGIDEPSLLDEIEKIINTHNLNIPGGLNPCVALGLRLLDKNGFEDNFPNENLELGSTQIKAGDETLFFKFLDLCEGKFANENQPYAKDLMNRVKQLEEHIAKPVSKKRGRGFELFQGVPNKLVEPKHPIGNPNP